MSHLSPSSPHKTVRCSLPNHMISVTSIHTPPRKHQPYHLLGHNPSQVTPKVVIAKDHNFWATGQCMSQCSIDSQLHLHIGYLSIITTFLLIRLSKVRIEFQVAIHTKKVTLRATLLPHTFPRNLTYKHMSKALIIGLITKPSFFIWIPKLNNPHDLFEICLE